MARWRHAAGRIRRWGTIVARARAAAALRRKRHRIFRAARALASSEAPSRIPPAHGTVAALRSIAHRAAAQAAQPRRRPHRARDQTAGSPVSRPALTVLTKPIHSAPYRMYTRLRSAARRVLKPGRPGLPGSTY